MERGAIYARHSTGDQKSVPDQVRECLEWAKANGVEVADEMIFSDCAVTGRTHERDGLKNLISALEQDRVHTIIVLRTSRLFRNLYRTLSFVAEQITDRRKRIVFISQNLDSAQDDRWRYVLPVLGMIDEMQASSSTAHIHAAHKGLHRKMRVWGSRTFGYQGQDVPGEKTNKGRPARVWAIDPDEAGWVRTVFKWFVKDDVPIIEIARRLTQQGAPPSPKCSSGSWGHIAVKGILTNLRYRGVWWYGARENVWQNRAGYSRQIEREKPLDECVFEELRIISDALWWKAQEKLQGCARQAGRKAKDPDKPKKPRFLNDMFICGKHARRLYVGGNGGSRMFCPDCQKDPKRGLFSTLPRQFATEALCSTIAELIRRDTGGLLDEVVAALRHHAERMQQPDPSEIARLHQEEARLTNHIRFIKSVPGETAADLDENRVKLQELQRDRAAVSEKLARVEAAARTKFEMPGASEIRALLDQMAEVLVKASGSDDDSLVAAARRIVGLITGGRIVLTQQGKAKAKGGWLRGTFRVHLLKPILDEFGASSDDGEHAEIHVDFRKPSLPEQLANDVMRLYEDDLIQKQIAKELTRRTGRKVGRNLVKKALQIAFAQRGEEAPDDRKRRVTLANKQMEPSKCHDPALVDRVMARFEDGQLYCEIAEAEGICADSVTAIVRRWHDEQGLSVPNGKARRKTLKKKSRKK